MRTPLAALVASATLSPLAPAQAPFEAPVVVATNRQQIVATPDLNGDGFADAVGWWVDSEYGEDPGQGSLHGWINDGAGELELAWEVPIHVAPTIAFGSIPQERMEVADLDADGREDWVMVDGNRLRVYRSRGAQAPELAIDQLGGLGSNRMEGLALADFDGDAQLELATVASQEGLQLWELDLDAGTATATHSLWHGIGSYGRLIAAELTGDSTPDLLVSGSRLFPVVGGTIQPWTESFGLAAGLGSDVMFMHDAGDVDGDGDLDVVTFVANATQGTAHVRVLRRTAPGTLVAEPLQIGAGPARVLADVDGDGDLDGVCCGGGGPPSPTKNELVSVFRVALNDGSGAFAPAMEWPGLGSRAIAGVVDLDHDGDVDLVAGRTVLYADGPLNRHPMPPLGEYPTERRCLADLDDDGDPDLDPGVGTWMRNHGDAGFTQAPLALPPPPAGETRYGSGYPADWDGDGDVDLLVQLGQPYAGTGLEMLSNLGGGRFESLGVVNAGSFVYAGEAENALPADLDGDGDSDLVLRPLPSDSFLPETRWLRNDGREGFVLQQTFAGLRVRHAADLDGDLLPELIAQGSGTGALVWLPNLGGSFGAEVAIPDTLSRASRDHVAVGDLDGDGDADVAATYWAQPVRGQIHWNDGLGNFEAEVHTTNLEWGHGVELLAHVMDVQGDGRLDVLFGPLDDAPNALGIWLREADGSGFEPPIVQPVLEEEEVYGIWHTDFAAADLDGDGDLELLGQRRLDNQTFHGSAAGYRRQQGEGTVGTGGERPVLGASGPFRVGETAVLRLRNLAPGAPGTLLVTDPAEPAVVLEQIGFQASSRPGFQPGTGSHDHAFAVDLRLAGAQRRYVAEIDDPAAVGGVATTNALILRFGP